MEFFHRQLKISVNIGQGGDKQISHILSLQPSVSKPVLKKLLHDVFLVCKRENTVSHIARRQHAQIFSQHPGTAAVVSYRDDRRYVETAVFFSVPAAEQTDRFLRR